MTDFSNTEAELTFEERKHLYNMLAIAFLLTVWAFLAYFVYLMDTNPLQIGWDFTIRFGIPFSIVEPTAWFLSYEVFYPKRVRKSRMFHIRRFARRTLSMITVMVSFFGIMSLSEITFSKTLGDDAIFPGIFLFLSIFGIAVFLWLRRHRIQY